MVGLPGAQRCLQEGGLLRCVLIFVCVAFIFGCVDTHVAPIDRDNDGFDEAVDCDDTNPLAYPGAPESCRDEVDLNCDGKTHYVPWPTTCEVHLVQQGGVSSLDLTGTGLRVGSISVNGSSVKSGKSHDIDAFLGFTKEEITETFASWVAKHDELTDDMIIILDMEHPIHPKELHEYLENPTLFTAIIEAYRLRIKVAREVLPNNPIALYGTVVPHGQGSESGFSDSRLGYVAAGEHGLYDDLDYLVPVIYHRFGPSDLNFENRLNDMTHQALKEAAALRRRDGSAIPLFPLLSLQIWNSKSNHSGEAPLPIHVDAIIEDLLLYPEVALFGFWTANDTSSPMDDIPAYFEAVSLLPVPGCSCPE